ncbi:MAG: YHS domain-containing protein [bacterium]|nr:MAG: YHS domain-containing protein [bacterium]
MRSLLFLLLAICLIWSVKALLRPLRQDRRPSRGGLDNRGGGEEMVRDPHCGVYVPRSAAVSKRVDGAVHHFCSEKCRDEFRSP